MEPVQGSNLNRRYKSGLEPEMPVTIYSPRTLWDSGSQGICDQFAWDP